MCIHNTKLSRMGLMSYAISQMPLLESWSTPWELTATFAIPRLSKFQREILRYQAVTSLDRRLWRLWTDWLPVLNHSFIRRTPGNGRYLWDLFSYEHADSTNVFLVNHFFTAFGCRVCQTLDGRRTRILPNSSSMSSCSRYLQTIKLTSWNCRRRIDWRQWFAVLLSPFSARQPF